MERSPAVDRVGQWARAHPFAVDRWLAAAVVFCTVLLPAPGYWEAPAYSLLLGLLLTVPVAWRRRAPVAAAAAVVAAGLIQLVTLNSFLAADVAALFMIYALAAYAPRWASRGGLALGLFGALLAALRYFSTSFSAQLLPTTGAIAVAVVASWALGDLRRAQLQRFDSLEERARLLEVERDQEMRLTATAERTRIARELHDVARPLRALGLARGQLHGLLGWEAVLVAGVAALLGVLLGGAYGLIGAASVLPARRAARTSSVAAIAA
ncbi:MAG: Two component integral rane signal transduction histidine kinase [Blastococcus sp.]|nr:Two component integral rane signal transduction histidine kinase [Blastococcus sp.]